jgi:DNA polymerase I-like protein with 3'-5' exonuclease and polymerase domains
MERLEQFAGLAKGLADRPLEGTTNATESASSYRIKLPFALLRPVLVPPRLEHIEILRGIHNPTKELAFIFENRQDSDFLAFDIETNGVDVLDPDVVVVGVGLADHRGSIYIDLASSPLVWPWLLSELGRRQVPLLMHNAYFDYSFILRDLPEDSPAPALGYCTYALFRLTSTEDWDGFSWSLKAAQKSLLGWHETNEKELDEWLVKNGHIKSVKKHWAEGHVWVPELADGEGRFAKPDKAKMYLAPCEILGHYCALDADATYLLFHHVLKPVLDRFHGLREYASPAIYGKYIRLMIEQKFNGMYVDIEQMRTWDATLTEKHKASIQEFYQHPDIQRYVLEIRTKMLQEQSSKEPPKYKEVTAKEPNRFTKTGKVNKGWLKWKEKQNKEKELTHRWLQWKEKMEDIESRTPQEILNMNSPKQKQELFYKFLKFPVLSLSKTSGEPGTGKDAIRGWGELGKILTRQNKLIKEKQYAEKVLNRFVPKTHSIHPGVIVPGTSSGRLAGAGKMNYQAFPKSYGFLSCIRARPGYKLVDMDFTALESVVLTELSRDKSMMLFYSPDANPHQDIHLFTTSKLPGIGKKVLEAGYNPDNPTPEGVENAKKLRKKEREVGKLINYASVYQAGGKTIARNLTLSGIPTSEEEGKEMHAAYWETFKGVKEYNRELERQWRLNNGWYLNGIGRPVCITDDMRKDLLSKCVQSTGHDCLVLLMVIYWDLLEKEGIEAYQWGEMHDQVIVEVIEHQAERAKHLLDKVALGKLNEMLGGLIPLRGEAQIVDSLAEAKNLKPEKGDTI